MFWTIILAGILVFLFWKLVVDDEEQPVDRVPGPRRRPIIGCALEFMNVDALGLFLMMRRLAKEYGDRYLIKVFKRRILHVYSPQDVEVVLSHSKNITKSLPYTFLQPWLGTGLLLSTGAKWHKRRKILTPTFHFNILKNFTDIMEEKSRDLVGRLKAQNGGKVNVMPIISDFTLFTICETAMGTQLDSDKSAKTVQYKDAIKDIGKLLMSRLTQVYLHSDFIFSLSSIGRRFQHTLKTVHEFADEVILDKKKQRAENIEEVITKTTEDIGAKKRQAMLDLLLEEESKGNIDLEGIREEVNTFMFEGHDTTAMGLAFALMLLADHEEVQHRVYEECQQIFGDSDRTPSMADMSEMKYLDAVIKETLRLYPSVPFIARLITEDFMLAGDLKIKKGTEVGVHFFDLHRRPELFPDPEAFKPERFLSGETRHPYAYVPFSAGPRNCIGQRFAILEMKCVLSEILRGFTLQAVEKGARPALLADMVLRPAQPIYVNFVPR